MSQTEQTPEKLEAIKREFQQRIHDHLLKENTIPDLAKFEPEYEKNPDLYMSALQSLASKYFIQIQKQSTTSYDLTQDGKKRVNEENPPEKTIYDFIGAGKIKKEITAQFKGPMMGLFNQLVSQGFLLLDNSVEGEPKYVYNPNNPFADKTRALLNTFITERNKLGQAFELKKDFLQLTKQKLVEKITTKTVSVSRGVEFGSFTLHKQVTLTNSMLMDGSWEKADLKEKKFTVATDIIPSGKLHPLVETRAQFRKIFLKLGFTEMFTRRYIESSFWNFDALFQPQAHPCRDQQDTFFVAAADRAQNNAANSSSSADTDAPTGAALAVSSASGATALREHDLARVIPAEVCTHIRAAHEAGGPSTGNSLGLRYKWNVDESRKNILRTHTTAISARTLASLTDELRRYWEKGQFLSFKKDEPSAKDLGSRPLCKFFSIDRVFRNETLDKTHLAEFHQLEGFVVGENLNVGDLMGTIKAFFAEIGMTDVKFQPTYNPYTEPSLEMYAYNNILKKWIEVGNSGIFRSEVMMPLGMKDSVRAIAWGLSLERPAMIQADIGDIESLFGKKVNIEWIEHSSSKMLHS